LTPTAITVNLDGKQSLAVYYGQFDDNGHKYAEFINFLYEDASGSPVVVYASLYCDYSNVDIFEFVSKLSFEHVPVNRTIEE
ncbi:MAG: hypothetical protein IJO48_01415, partial [Clostridia bacterium]|nr:hypothetical protein [Clostridia bacterium]